MFLFLYVSLNAEVMNIRRFYLDQAQVFQDKDV